MSSLLERSEAVPALRSHRSRSPWRASVQRGATQAAALERSAPASGQALPARRFARRLRGEADPRRALALAQAPGSVEPEASQAAWSQQRVAPRWRLGQARVELLLAQTRRGRELAGVPSERLLGSDAPTPPGSAPGSATAQPAVPGWRRGAQVERWRLRREPLVRVDQAHRALRSVQVRARSAPAALGAGQAASGGALRRASPGRSAAKAAAPPRCPAGATPAVDQMG